MNEEEAMQKIKSIREAEDIKSTEKHNLLEKSMLSNSKFYYNIKVLGLVVMLFLSYWIFRIKPGYELIAYMLGIVILFYWVNRK